MCSSRFLAVHSTPFPFPFPSESLRRTLLILACCLWLTSAGKPNQALGADQRPNLILIFADDMTYDAMSHLGVREVQTPHLDQLARRGTFFTHASNMGSWNPAVCVASRSMLLTGRALWRAEKAHSQLKSLAADGKLWPQRLQAAGYRTYMTGKWHLPVPAEEVFQNVKHVRAGMPKDVPDGYNRPIDGQPDGWHAADKSLGGYWEGGRHWSEVLAEDAIAFLGTASGNDAPYLMYLAFNAPHDPRQAPQEYLDRYPAKSLSLPQSFLPIYPYAKEMGCPVSLRDERLAPFPRTPASIRQHLSEYYALITHLDDQIGRILDALEQNPSQRETVICFTADHGLAMGQHGLMGKQNLYDHSLRVPFILASFPSQKSHAGKNSTSPATHAQVAGRVPAGLSINQPIYLQSVAATFLEWAEVPLLADEEFPSLLPVIRESQVPAATATSQATILRKSAATTGGNSSSVGESNDVIGSYLDLQRSITSRGYKLILYPQAKAQRLYDLSKDPLELHDLAEDSATLLQRKSLFSRLRQWQVHFGDTLPLSDSFPELITKSPGDPQGD